MNDVCDIIYNSRLSSSDNQEVFELLHLPVIAYICISVLTVQGIDLTNSINTRIKTSQKTVFSLIKKIKTPFISYFFCNIPVAETDFITLVQLCVYIHCKFY